MQINEWKLLSWPTHFMWNKRSGCLQCRFVWLKKYVIERVFFQKFIGLWSARFVGNSYLSIILFSLIRRIGQIRQRLLKKLESSRYAFGSTDFLHVMLLIYSLPPISEKRKRYVFSRVTKWPFSMTKIRRLEIAPIES